MGLRIGAFGKYFSPDSVFRANFNGSQDPMITADRSFIQFLGPDFGFLLLGSSDRGSQRSLGNFTFSLLCTACHAVEKMTRNSMALQLDVVISLLFLLVSGRFCFDTDVGYINISLIVILNAKHTISRNSRKFQQLIALYLGYHLTRQTIWEFGFS